MRGIVALALLVALTPSVASSQVFRAFLTNGFTDGNMGGLAGADAMCSAAAEAEGLGGLWVAWLSTSTVDAVDRLTEGEFELLNGDPVAASIADLTDGTIVNAISITEDGDASNDGPWTGTESDGTASAAHCDDWTTSSGEASGERGDSTEADAQWTQTGSQACSNQNPIYCFEIAPAVPATPTAASLCLALLVLGAGASLLLRGRYRPIHSRRA